MFINQVPFVRHVPGTLKFHWKPSIKMSALLYDMMLMCQSGSIRVYTYMQSDCDVRGVPALTWLALAMYRFLCWRLGFCCNKFHGWYDMARLCHCDHQIYTCCGRCQLLSGSLATWLVYPMCKGTKIKLNVTIKTAGLKHLYQLVLFRQNWPFDTEMCHWILNWSVSFRIRKPINYY